MNFINDEERAWEIKYCFQLILINMFLATLTVIEIVLIGTEHFTAAFAITLVAYVISAIAIVIDRFLVKEENIISDYAIIAIMPTAANFLAFFPFTMFLGKPDISAYIIAAVAVIVGIVMQVQHTIERYYGDI